MQKIVNSFVFGLLSVALLLSSAQVSFASSSILGTTGTEPRAIVVDGSGNVYTANYTSGDVTKITPGGVSTTIAGYTGNGLVSMTKDSSDNIYVLADISNSVSIRSPGGFFSSYGDTAGDAVAIVADNSGNVYIANSTQNKVAKLEPGRVYSLLGNTGSSPRAITIDGSGNVYTANSDSNNVSKITPGGVSTILGTTGISPRAITIDGSGNIYTANYTSGDVTKITPGGVSTTLGTTGSNPIGIIVDSNGNVYTANSGSNNVSKITPEGVSTVFGTTGSMPYALTMDLDGNIYTANALSNNVSKINNPTIATITSNTYTVSDVGGGSETITDVPFGTSKADFLANLTKGSVDQTWNDTNISDPVLTGDTLVVTAEDGTTIITYTVTVLPEPSHDATVTSNVYTVSTSGGANRTITNVPFATSQGDFLDNLTKGNIEQSWDSSDLNDPVLTGDTLVVTAEDGTTIITYTITTLVDSGVDIDTCVEFEGVDDALSRTYRLTADLDCTSEGNNIMVGVNSPFTGNFDGQNHTITIAINARSSSNVGLFGQASGAIISNLTIAGVVHGGESGYEQIGSLVGYGSDLTINNITSTASVSGNRSVGGLIGYLDADNGDSIVDSSSTSGNISGIGNRIGGLVGYVYTESGDITITNSHSSGAVDGNSYVGGLVGYVEHYYGSIVTVSNSYSTSSVIGYSDSVGGLIGYIYGGGNSEEGDRTAVNILNSYHTTGNVFEGGNGGGQSVGGIVGDVYLDYTANFALSDSYATGSVSNTTGYAGGLIGNLVQGDDSGYGGNINILRNHFSGTVSTGTSSYAGGLVGYLNVYVYSGDFTSSIIINNNYSTANISGTADLGGLIGGLNLSNNINQPLTFTFNQNHASGVVTGGGQGEIGGLIGAFDSYDDDGSLITATLDQNYFTGTMLETNGGSTSYGGLFGYIQIDGDPFTISNSYSTANITGYQYTGGLIGSSTNVNITDSYATGNVTGNERVGGLVGYSSNSNIIDSYATGNVTGTGNGLVGGLIGSSTSNSSIETSFATGDVIGVKMVGGLVGINHQSSSIENSYARGDVTGSGIYVGGLVGANRGSTIDDSYASGVVIGTTNVGGLTGINDGTITNSFYDELTGQTDEGKGVLTTTTLMKTETNFTDADWNFTDTWGIDTTLAKNNGYPYLQWELYPGTPVASPVAGTYSSAQTVSFTSTGSSSIRYSTVATPADCSNGTLYSTPISVSESQTIYTRACNSIGNSIPKSFAYTISYPNPGAVLGGGGGGGGFYISPTINPPTNTNTVCNAGQIFSTTTGQRCTTWTTNPSTSSGQVTYNFGNVTLRLGSRGEAVKELQRFLNDNLNLDLVIDGKLGPKTIAVIKQWQKDHGLVPDGLVGKKTKDMMNGKI